MTWIVLFAAAVFEIVWALALKQSDGFSNTRPTIVFALAAPASMVLLAIALRSLPVGTAYAVWTGTGAVGTAIAGVILLGEPASISRMLAILLIAVGIVWLTLVTEVG